MRIVFMGTPDFSVRALELLVEKGHEICLVVTQPDREKGRGKELAFSPVKQCALRHNIPVFQPARVKKEESVEILRQQKADIFVVAAFGQILSKEILEIPKFGCINIHASLLPRYRGASPIQWAILNGDPVTGITIMQMDEGLDTGDILSQQKVAIEHQETGESLFEKLSITGAKLLVDTLPEIEAGRIVPLPQNTEEATHVGMLRKEMGKIDWNKEAVVLERLVRGMNSWPGAFFVYQEKNLKVWKSGISSFVAPKKSVPGEVVFVEKETFGVATGKGVLEILEIQPPGKKRMPVKEFLLGHHLEVGDILEA